jgi:hypothetical protein
MGCFNQRFPENFEMRTAKPDRLFPQGKHNYNAVSQFSQASITIAKTFIFNYRNPALIMIQFLSQKSIFDRSGQDYKGVRI